MLRFSIVVTCLLACGKGSDAPKQEAKPADKSVESTPKEPAPNPVIAELAKVGEQLCACTDLNCINKMESKLFVTAQKTSVKNLGKADTDALAAMSKKLEACEAKLLSVGDPGCDAAAAKSTCTDPASLAKASEITEQQLTLYLQLRNSIYERFILVHQMKTAEALKPDSCDDIVGECLKDFTFKK